MSESTFQPPILPYYLETSSKLGTLFSSSALATSLLLPLLFGAGCGGSTKSADTTNSAAIEPVSTSEVEEAEEEMALNPDTGGWKDWLEQACECESIDSSFDSIRSCMDEKAREAEEIGDTMESFHSSSTEEQHQWVNEMLSEHKVEGCSYLTELKFLAR